MDLGRGNEKTFEGWLNHRQMQDVGVTYAHYGAAMAVSFPRPISSYKVFPFEAAGLLCSMGPRDWSRATVGIVSGPGADMRIRYSSDFEHLILRIRPEKLTRTLTA